MWYIQCKSQVYKVKRFSIRKNYLQLFFYTLTAMLIYTVWMCVVYLTGLTHQQKEHNGQRLIANGIVITSFSFLVAIIINYYNIVCFNNTKQQLEYMSEMLFIINNVPQSALQRHNEKIKYATQQAANYLTELHQTEENNVGNNILFRNIIIIAKLISISVIFNTLKIIDIVLRETEQAGKNNQSNNVQNILNKIVEMSKMLTFINHSSICFMFFVLLSYIVLALLIDYRYNIINNNDHTLNIALNNHVILPYDYDAKNFNLDYNKLYKNNAKTQDFDHKTYTNLIIIFNIIIITIYTIWIYYHRHGFISTINIVVFLLSKNNTTIAAYTTLICVSGIITFGVISLLDLNDNIKNFINYKIYMAQIYQNLQKYYDILNNLPYAKNKKTHHMLNKNIDKILFKNVCVYLDRKLLLKIPKLQLKNQTVYSIKGKKYKTILASLIGGKIPHKSHISDNNQFYYTGLIKLIDNKGKIQNMHSINDVDLNNISVRAAKGNGIRYDNFEDNFIGNNNINKNPGHLEYLTKILHLHAKLQTRKTNLFSGGESDRSNLLFMMKYLMSRYCNTYIFIMDNIGSSFDSVIFNNLLEKLRILAHSKKLFILVIDNNKNVHNNITHSIVIKGKKVVIKHKKTNSDNNSPISDELLV